MPWDAPHVGVVACRRLAKMWIFSGEIIHVDLRVDRDMALSKRCLLLLLLLLRASVSACWRALNSSWSSRSRAFRNSTNLAICGSIRQVSQPAKGSRVTSRRCKTAAVCGWLVVHLTKPFPLFLEFSPLDIQCLHTLAHTLPLSHALLLSLHEAAFS